MRLFDEGKSFFYYYYSYLEYLVASHYPTRSTLMYSICVLDVHDLTVNFTLH